MKIITKRNYDFFEVSSAMQKGIRRGDAKLSGYWALELWASGYGQYVWKRLLTISAEDCWGILTTEIYNLHQSYLLINKNVPSKTPKGRIFISKAVILLCLSKKNRDADHLQNIIYDQGMEKNRLELENDLSDNRGLEIPDYAYDCHTQQGRKLGKTKKDFFVDEQQGLFPKAKGLFDDLVYE